jgi:hypothetical protein
MKASNGNGKGDWPRPVNRTKYEKEYERIYGEQPLRNVWRKPMKKSTIILQQIIDDFGKILDKGKVRSNIYTLDARDIVHIEGRLLRLLVELRGEESNGV